MFYVKLIIFTKSSAMVYEKNNLWVFNTILAGVGGIILVCMHELPLSVYICMRLRQTFLQRSSFMQKSMKQPMSWLISGCLSAPGSKGVQGVFDMTNSLSVT